MVSSGRRRLASRAAARNAGTTVSIAKKPSRANVNWRPGSAAIRSSAFRVSLSSVVKSRLRAAAIPGTSMAGTSKTTAATMRWTV